MVCPWRAPTGLLYFWAFSCHLEVADPLNNFSYSWRSRSVYLVLCCLLLATVYMIRLKHRNDPPARRLISSPELGLQEGHLILLAGVHEALTLATRDSFWGDLVHLSLPTPALAQRRRQWRGYQIRWRPWPWPKAPSLLTTIKIVNTVIKFGYVSAK